MPPNTGKLKLNTDGSSINNANAGGGVDRNSKGEIIIAFSLNLGKGDSLTAEVLALLFGLNLCYNNSIVVNDIEVDSKPLYEFLNNISKSPWNLTYVLRKCKTLIKDNMVVMHSFREGNMLADYLSKDGHFCNTPKVFTNPRFLNKHGTNIFIADQLGLSNFRPP